MLVDLDIERCDAVAEVLRAVGLDSATEPWCESSEHHDYDLATLNFALVAICHQTQSIEGKIDDTVRRGWDYLQTGMLRLAASEPNLPTPEGLQTVDEGTLVAGLPELSSLAPGDLRHRVALVNGCGRFLSTAGLANVSELYHRCRRLASGSDGLLAQLSSAEAYGDPVRKKALFLLGLNSATCGWTYADQEPLDPPVDYHEVRGHLRLRTIRVLDAELEAAIFERRPVTEEGDIAIRTAVTEALRRISASASISPTDLHYGFWNLFRTRCTRKKPMCCGEEYPIPPSPYDRLVPDGKCCLIDQCPSALAEHAVDEHVFDTDWY